MNSRSAMLFSVLGLALIAGGILWFTQGRSTSTVTVPTGPAAPRPLDATASDHELAEPGKPTPVAAARDNRPPAADVRRTSAQNSASPHVAPTPVALAPEALQPQVIPPPVVTETESPKPSTLDPIRGGVPAIQSKYAGSTYDERRARADVLEAGLGGAGPSDSDQQEAYQALKDELIWLRENMGKPPVAAPK